MSIAEQIKKLMPSTNGEDGDLSRLSRRTSLLLVLPLLAIMAICFIIPIVKLFFTSLSGEGRGYLELLGDTGVQKAFLLTFQIALEVTLIALVLGYVLAFAMWRGSRVFQGVCIALVMFPLFTSLIIRNYAWKTAFSRNGVLNQILAWLGMQPVDLLNSHPAVLVGMVHVMLPFSVLPIWTVLNRLDPSLYRASLSLGANPWQSFRKVIFPLSAPGVTVASLMVFIMSVGFYVTPAILGGPRVTMVANLIDTEVNTYLDFRAGASLSFVLLIITLAIVGLAYRVLDVDRLLREQS